MIQGAIVIISLSCVVIFDAGSVEILLFTGLLGITAKVSKSCCDKLWLFATLDNATDYMLD
jgi:hypothetical protein